MVKGEAFLLASLIIIVGLVFMYLPLRREYLITQYQILSREYEEKIFDNVLNEIKNLVYISLDNFDSYILATYDFLNFSERYVTSKTLTFSALTILGNVSSNLNLSVINFYRDSVLVTFTLNSSERKSIFVNSYSINSTSFSLDSKINNLTIEYDNVKKEIEISNKNKLVFHIDLFIEGIEYSKRYVEVFVFS